MVVSRPAGRCYARPMPRRFTASGFAQLARKLERCPVVDGVRQVPDKLAERAMSALRQAEADERDTVIIPHLRL